MSALGSGHERPAPGRAARPRAAAQQPGEARPSSSRSRCACRRARGSRRSRRTVSSPRATPSHSARSMSSGSRLVAVAELGGEARAALAAAPRRSRRCADRGLAPGRRRRAPPRATRQVVAEHDRDRRRLDGAPAGASTSRGPRAEPQPADLAVVAQPVEPGGLVVAQPAREQLGLPRGRGRLAALQLLETRRRARRRRRAGCPARGAASAAGSA